MAPPLRFWALIPAAGRGARMGLERPKQYLTLGGKTMLEHSLGLFLDHARIAGVVVALAPQDPYWPQLKIAHTPRVHAVTGGDERAQSVLAGLRRLGEMAGQEDWVLVHDAARPCLDRGMIDRLMAELEQDPVGGLLALPARDTIKQAQEGRVAATLDRRQLWHAQTPQMFRLGALHAALTGAIAAGRAVTDESMAMELAGHAPRLVEGSADNLKITRREDLGLAEFILRRRAEGVQ
ncbi:MAG TPA: 2-C-methyl-D-erythritol 4-phosphate cytidylyltransferase [Nevskiales bacterium]|nr:2-C-methyl-D-erythritol 4-phosphate cytidylyltransferase [Nevskiales bacterium]